MFGFASVDASHKKEQLPLAASRQAFKICVWAMILFPALLFHFLLTRNDDLIVQNTHVIKWLMKVLGEIASCNTEQFSKR
jgi:hypothetical protein